MIYYFLFTPSMNIYWLLIFPQLFLYHCMSNVYFSCLVYFFWKNLSLFYIKYCKKNFTILCLLCSLFLSSFSIIVQCTYTYQLFGKLIILVTYQFTILYFRLHPPTPRKTGPHFSNILYTHFSYIWPSLVKGTLETAKLFAYFFHQYLVLKSGISCEGIHSKPASTAWKPMSGQGLSVKF